MLKETIKKARMNSCLTQEEMADRMNMSKTKYLRKENGITKLTRDEVKNICKILDIKEETLLTVWMADSIYDILKRDKQLARDVLVLLDKHIDDYESWVTVPDKSDSYSSFKERLFHYIYK